VNDIAYTDRTVTVVHVEHFASQGANIPNWLGQNSHPRARLGLMAREAVINYVVGFSAPWFKNRAGDSHEISHSCF
jgi:hypothetical protein